MPIDRSDLLLYAITDGQNTTAEQVELALKGGATIVQIREKNITRGEYALRARQFKLVCQKYGAKLIVNDDVTVAYLSGADGVHVGAEDVPVAEIREKVFHHALYSGKSVEEAEEIAKNFIIGATAKTVEQAVKAQADGADYLGCGAVFPSPTKTNAIRITAEQLKEITSSVHIPVVAIGGITEHNMSELAGTGISGVAVVSSLFGEGDVLASAILLRLAAKEVVE